MEFLSIVIKVTFNVNKMFNQTKYVDIDIFIFDKFFLCYFYISKKLSNTNNRLTFFIHILINCVNYSGYYNIERSNYRYLV